MEGLAGGENVPAVQALEQDAGKRQMRGRGTDIDPNGEYDDLVIIRTRLLNVRDSLLHFGYEVLRDQDGALLAEGETVHLVLDSELKRARLSARYLPSFLKAAGRS